MGSGIGSAYATATGGVTPLTVALPTAVVQYGRSTVTMADPAPAGPSGTPVYAWTWLQQPGSATFSSTSVAQPTLTPDAAGEWVALCTVTLAGQTAYFVHTVNVGRVLYHLDWTGESTVDIKAGGVGPYTFGGVTTWSALNPTACASFDVVNGTGLVIVSQAGVSAPNLDVTANDLATMDGDKRYCWLHKVTVAGATADYGAGLVTLKNAAVTPLATAAVGYYVWGQVDRLLGAGDQHAAATVNTSHLIGLEFDGAYSRMRREAGTTYKDPADVAVVLEGNIVAAAWDRTTDIVGFGYGGNQAGVTITITDSWLVEME